MTDVEIEFRKFGGTPYTEFRTRRLGEDEHGVWLRSDPPIELRVPLLSADWFTLDWGCTWLIPSGATWWTMLCRSDDGLIGVDICQPAEWVSPSHVVAVDLDVDCWLTSDGDPAPPDLLGRSSRWSEPLTIVGEQELRSNQAALGYSDALVEQALVSQADVEHRLRRRAEPFGEALQRWLRVQPK